MINFLSHNNFILNNIIKILNTEDIDFDFSGDEWFDDEVIRWNTESKRQYLFELVEVCSSRTTVLKFIFTKSSIHR